MTKQEVFDLLPKRVTLHYVDYRDNLDEQTELLQKCLTNKSKDALYETVDEWFWDDHSGIDYVMDELRSDIENAGEDPDECIEMYEDEIRDEIYNRDDSDVISGLLRHTKDFALFIPTGLEFDGYGNSRAQYRLDRMTIKKFFNIKNSDQDGIIDMMIAQAGYGGELRVYFNEDTEDLLNAVETHKSITFNGTINIAIANSGNGSGDHTEIVGSCTLPLDVYICKEVGYSYTHDVCGMYDDWCGSTQFQYSDEEIESDSKTADFMKEEAEKDRVFKEGGCTFGDMKYTRHRDVYYINNFPCGNKCPHCGTFWID